MFVPVASLKGNAVINLSSSSAVSWPTTPPAAVAPVSAVPSAPAVAGGGRETQTGSHSGREGAGHAFASPAGARMGAREAGSLRPQAASPDGAIGVEDHHAAAAQREQVQQEAHAARERDQRAMEHLKEVLTNVWQASAAVVDRALGRESADATPGTRSDTAPDLSQVAATLVARRAPVLTTSRTVPHAPSPSGLPWVPDASQEDPLTSEVVAYDERGNSSLVPLEAGSLISHRV